MGEDGYDDVCVLIPTYNEAATIGEVIDGFHEQGLTNVLVVDGHSTDGTREIARERGARVVEQSGTGRGSGKGQAVREGIDLIEEPYVLMLDGDGTYRPEDATAMLEPLLSGEAEHVVGDRFANIEEGAMPRLNQFGNRIINAAFRLVHRRDLGDILSGYRAFTRESVRRFGLSATGFAIETELSVECVKHSISTEIVPITYAARPEDSETNLHPFKDGGRIALTLYQLAKTNNPLFYFGSVGLLSLLFGGVVGAYVGYEWFERGVSHEVLALVSAVGILVGILLSIFGVLSDVIVSLHREQLRRIRQLERAVEHSGGRDATPETDGDAADRRITDPVEGVGQESTSPAEAPQGSGSDPDPGSRTEEPTGPEG